MVIADDEEIERKALSLLVQKEFPLISVVGLAENGVELLTLVEKTRPDIAIVDINMPGINGIDAVDLLRSRGVDTRFVVNTAYSDFEYVQRALSLKVDAYILKPQKRAEAIATIKKLCDSIDETRVDSQSQQQIRDLFGRIQPVMESEIMYSIFINDPAVNSLATWCEMHAVKWELGVMVTLLPADGGAILRGQEKVSLQRELHRALEASCTGLLTSTESSVNLLVFVSQKDSGNEERWHGWLQDVLQVLLEDLRRSCGLLMRAGVGRLYDSLRQMPESYHESLLALRATNSIQICFYKSDGVQDAHTAQLEELARLLAEDACHGRLSNLEKLLEENQRFLLANIVLLARLWDMCRAAIVEMGRGSVELRAFFRMVGHTLEQEPDGEKGLAHLSEKLCHLSTMLTSKRGANPYVVQAIQLIEEQYRRDISLDSVAAEISISPFYLSRLLKTELGQTFIEYLTQVRIQEAVRLARTTRLSIKEIAERTGYQNPTYFCRVFKKHTGKTIGDVRDQPRME